MGGWTDRSVREVADAVRRGEVSAEAVTRDALDRIEERDAALGAFLHVAADDALRQARRLDAERAAGRDPGILAGVVVALKDNLCAAGMPATCGSRILVRDGRSSGIRDPARRGWMPPYDATAVQRLRAAGAVLVGKTNMDEFAMGSSTENGAFGPARNPHAPDRVPGGSSGGSAVAVAAAMAHGAIGSDTGGSIRQPAAFCGVVGVKPTYGRVSRHGLVAFASSLDQVGPVARDVRGAARLLEVVAGRDDRDATSLGERVGAYEAACDRGARGLRVGVPEDYFGDGLDADVAASVRRAIDALARSGCEVRDIRLPHTQWAVATYYIVATAEASSNLARFDGVRYGLRVEAPGADLAAMYGATRDRGFGAEVKRRILLGTYVLSAGYYDAYYLKAQKVRTLVRRDFLDAFRDVDVVVGPVSPVPPFRLGERVDDPLAMYLADVFTLPASLAGLPAASVPCDPVPARPDRPALPTGLHVVAPPLGEERMFAVAAAVEAARGAGGGP